MDNIQNVSWSGWETVRLIGRGNFGAVYEIQRNVFDNVEKAALKVISIPQNGSDVEEMHNDGYDNESITATFQSHLKSIVAEYSLMRKMSGCHNIVNCEDVRYIQHEDGIGWDILIKMELLTPLVKALPAEIPEKTVIKIAEDMCAALRECKKFNVVHRDIKPQNIFVAENGDYKLGDFGIAKTVEKTLGGTKIGTYKYMAPEVYNNQPYGTAADIYSLGLVLYWLLNERRLPFVPLPPRKLKMDDDEIARGRRLRGELLPEPAHGSEGLKRIVLRACAYDVKDRYKTAEELQRDLQALQAGTLLDMPMPAIEPVDPAPTPKIEPLVEPPQRKTKRNGMRIVLGCCLCAIAALAWIGKSDVKTTIGGRLSGKEGNTAKEWSEWADELPASVVSADYEIEEQTLYRSRTLETTSSTTQSSMPGWELYDTVDGAGEWGAWSDWSSSGATASGSRQVETQTRYRFRDRETTTSSSPNKDGWERYDTTYSSGDWGGWSGWSSSPAYESNNRDVETKKEYRYRTISVSEEYGSWGGWSSWQDDYVGSSSVTDVETRTAYHYYYFRCSNCGAHMHGSGTCYSWAGGCGSNAVSSGSYEAVRYTTPYSQASDWRGTGTYYAYGDEGLAFAYISTSSSYYIAPITQYRYRSRDTIESKSYSEWSGWSDERYSEADNREVETREMYRYRDRQEVPTYHFARWGSWSSWNTSAVSASGNRQVESTTYYRYRDKVQEKTYYFRRWSDWGEFSNVPIEASETTQVESVTQYRFRKK